MTQGFGITTEMVSASDSHWSFLGKTETVNEDMEVVEGTEIVTGALAFSLKAMDLLDRYQMWLESERVRRINLAKSMLYEVGVS